MKKFMDTAIVFLIAAGILSAALLACSPVQVANSPEAEKGLTVTSSVTDEPSNGYVPVIVVDDEGEPCNGFSESETWYCDSCGEPTTDVPQTRTFDDGTTGDCCEYCAAFFTLDQADRDAIRASWA